MKKIVVSFLACVMLFMTLNLVAFANVPKSSDDSYEVVLVIDTSGSMKTSDPANSDNTRISTEAMESFALKCSQSEDMSFKLSVVIYNSKVHTLVKSLDITTESGKTEYQNAIRKLNNNEVYEADGTRFNCWAGKTNIGLAMQYAKGILDDSNATKKAVMLFTDGQIELATPAQEQESERIAKECSNSFKNDKIPLFCIGLNKSNTVNEAFLKMLSDGTGNENFAGRTEVCTDADELKTLFDDVYAYFSGAVNEEEPPVLVSPTIPYEKNLYIYNDAINSLTISLNCDHKLKTVKITDPKGNVVVDANITTGTVDYDETRCSYDSTMSRRNIIITLNSPVGGNWKISLSSEVATTVTISKIVTNDLMIKGQLPTEVLAGDSFTTNLSLWNKTKNKEMEDLKIYADSECRATVEDSNGNIVKNFIFRLNASKDGYLANFDGLATGTYKIKFNISNSSIGNAPFSVAAVSTIRVVDPKIIVEGEGANLTIGFVNPLTNEKMIGMPGSLTGKNVTIKIYKNNAVVDQKNVPLTSFTDGTYRITISDSYGSGDFYCIASVGDTIVSDQYAFDFTVPAIKVESNSSSVEVGKNVSIKVTLYDSDTLQAYTTIPSNLAGKSVLIKVIKDGSVVAEKTVAVSDFEKGIYTYNTSSNVAGNFTCTAEVVGLTIVSAPINFEVVNKPVVVVKEPSSIDIEIDVKKTDSFNYQFKLDDIFYDEDGHELSYKVDVTGNNITYEIKNRVVYITVSNITETVDGKITVTASDGYGSSASVTSGLVLRVKEDKVVAPSEPVNPKTIILIIVIIVVILLIAAVVAFIVIHNKSKINVKFSIRLSVDDEEGDTHYSIYNVNRKPAVVSGLPPKLSVMEVIRRCSTLSDSTDPDDKGIVDGKLSLLNDVYVIGVPFKDAIKLFDKDKKRVCYMKSAAMIAHKVGKETIKVEIAKFENWEIKDEEY